MENELHIDRSSDPLGPSRFGSRLFSDLMVDMVGSHHTSGSCSQDDEGCGIWSARQGTIHSGAGGRELTLR
jgi:hypothetical protein